MNCQQTGAGNTRENKGGHEGWAGTHLPSGLNTTNQEGRRWMLAVSGRKGGDEATRMKQKL